MQLHSKCKKSGRDHAQPWKASWGTSCRVARHTKLPGARMTISKSTGSTKPNCMPTIPRKEQCGQTSQEPQLLIFKTQHPKHSDWKNSKCPRYWSIATRKQCSRTIYLSNRRNQTQWSPKYAENLPRTTWRKLFRIRSLSSKSWYQKRRWKRNNWTLECPLKSPKIAKIITISSKMQVEQPLAAIVQEHYLKTSHPLDSKAEISTNLSVCTDNRLKYRLRKT